MDFETENLLLLVKGGFQIQSGTAQQSLNQGVVTGGLPSLPFWLSQKGHPSLLMGAYEKNSSTNSYQILAITAAPDANGKICLATSCKAASTGSAPAAVAIAAATTAAVALNAARKGLVLVNTSANDMSLAFGAAAAVLNSGITLKANGGTWVMDAFNYTTEAISAIAGAAGSNLAVQEFV